MSNNNNLPNDALPNNNLSNNDLPNNSLFNNGLSNNSLSNNNTLNNSLPKLLNVIHKEHLSFLIKYIKTTYTLIMHSLFLL